MTTGEEPKRVVIYARVSTDEKQQPHSIETQIERCRGFCTAYGYEVVTVVTDACSGTKLKTRPGIQEVLRLLKERLVEGVVIWKLDRLSRSVEHTQFFLNKVFRGKRFLASVHETLDTSTAMGKMVINILASVNQGIADIAGENISANLNRLKRQNKRYCAKVFGYDTVACGKRADGSTLYRLEENDAEMACIKRMEVLHAAGTPLTRIAKILKEEKYKTAKNRHWTDTTVKRILERRKNEREERIKIKCEGETSEPS